MKRRIVLCLSVVIAVLMSGTFALPATAESQAEAKKVEAQTVAQKCLACHGPYDKLAEKTAGFKASSGETVTPHQYVPHAEKKEFPECTGCHLVPHPVPLQDKSEVVKPDGVAWCYSSCHHASNLQPCKACH